MNKKQITTSSVALSKLDENTTNIMKSLLHHIIIKTTLLLELSPEYSSISTTVEGEYLRLRFEYIRNTFEKVDENGKVYPILPGDIDKIELSNEEEISLQNKAKINVINSFLHELIAHTKSFFVSLSTTNNSLSTYNNDVVINNKISEFIEHNNVSNIIDILNHLDNEIGIESQNISVPNLVRDFMKTNMSVYKAVAKFLVDYIKPSNADNVISELDRLNDDDPLPLVMFDADNLSSILNRMDTADLIEFVKQYKSVVEEALNEVFDDELSLDDYNKFMSMYNPLVMLIFVAKSQTNLLNNVEAYKKLLLISTLYDEIINGENTVMSCLLKDIENSIMDTTIKILTNTGLTYMNDVDYNTNLIDREEELERLISIINKMELKHPMIIGHAGCGKSVLIKYIVNNLDNYKTVKSFHFFKAVSLSQVINSLVELCTHINRIISVSREVNENNVTDQYGLTELIQEVSKYYDEKGIRLIFVVDEIHKDFKNRNNNQVADLIKQILESSKFSFIGLTTEDEYRRYIEPDKAVVRRFELLHINETDKDTTIKILKNMKKRFETEFNVKISDDNIERLVDYVYEYYRTSYRKNPELSIDVMDSVFSYASLHDIKEIDADIIKMVLAQRINAKIETFINHSDKAEVLNKAKYIEDVIRNRVFGQDHAVNPVINRIKAYLLGLTDKNRPIGSFLMIGPTGVGKTELAKAVAEAMFGDENNMVRFDMSEYQEPHSLSKLIGSPPGYVGHDNGGLLTNQVRNNPNVVILFDEIDKAHPRVLLTLMQALDDGRISDSYGTYDLSKSIIMMTSNFFSDYIAFHAEHKSFNEIKNEIIRNLPSKMKPELINRFDSILVFNVLSDEAIISITRKFLNQFVETFQNTSYNIIFENEDDIIDYIVNNKYDKKYGARSIRRYIDTLKSHISNDIINNMFLSGDIKIYLETISGNNKKLRYKLI